MNSRRPRHSFLRMVLFAIAASLPAQIPDGARVLSSWTAAGGLHVVDASGLVTPIGGLPASLARANLVLREPTLPGQPTRIVTANSQAVAGGSVDLLVLDIVASGGPVPSYTAVLVASHYLGTRGSSVNAAVHQAAWLRGGRRLAMATNGIVAGPAATSTGWILDLANGALTPMPLGTFAASGFNAVAVSRDGNTVYLAQFAAPYQVLQVPLNGAGPAVIANTSPFVTIALHPGCDGWLTAVASNTPNTMVAHIKPSSGGGPASMTSTIYQGLAANAAVIDPVDCSLQLVNFAIPGGMPTCTIAINPKGVLGAPGPALSIGLPTGLDLDPNPETYFAGSAVPDLAMSWAMRPFPGGRPTTGNSSFRLDVTLDGVPFYMACLLGLGSSTLLPAQVPFGPLTTNIVPTDFVFPAQSTLLLPIPPNPVLRGQPVTAQAFGLSGAPGGGIIGWANTEALHFTVQ